MSGDADLARALYLELRALRLDVRVVDDPYGGPLDYGIALDRLFLLPEAQAQSLIRRVQHNEEGLVRVLLDLRDPDLNAIRREGYCQG